MYQKKQGVPPSAITRPRWKLLRFFFNQSINHFIFLPKSAYTENEFDSSGQKKETMAKRNTFIYAHEKNLD